MERREKVEFILAQVGLCIESGDWTQAGILSHARSARAYLSRQARRRRTSSWRRERKEREKKRARGEEVPARRRTTSRTSSYSTTSSRSSCGQARRQVPGRVQARRQVLDTEAGGEDLQKLRAVSLPLYPMQPDAPC